jgi:hypothetical protein
MAGVSGPFTLATRLTQLSADDISAGAQPSESALELAAAAITKIVSAFVESGANLIFLREEIFSCSHDSPATVEAWAAGLGPACNIIRFYGALPVLQLASGALRSGSIGAILTRTLDATICLPPAGLAEANADRVFGLSLPIEALEGGDDFAEIQSPFEKGKPVLITTDGDIPASTDLRRLMRQLEILARSRP